MIGTNFPILDYYKDNIMDAETISRGGKWWTAVLLIKDPTTEKPFVAIYRWELTKTGWRVRKSVTFKQQKHLKLVIGALSKFVEQMD